jgi:hypothetical protein
MSIFTDLEEIASISDIKSLQCRHTFSNVPETLFFNVPETLFFNVPETLFSDISPDSFSKHMLGKKPSKIPLTISTISNLEDSDKFQKMTDYLKNEERIQNNDEISFSIPILPISKYDSDKFQKIPYYLSSKKKRKISKTKTLTYSNISITSENLSSDNVISIGIYTRAERLLKIKRYRLKKRKFSTEITYECRSKFAKNRPREGGRFIPIS